MKSFHLAGIIPVSGVETDYNLPWHGALMPIDDGYTLLHRAIMECAWAGCETIWIVMDPDTTPVFRKMIGDYVFDPVNYWREMEVDKKAQRVESPIFFTSISVKDRGKRDSYAWSILEGANMAYRVSKQLSKWIKPDMFYVAFPWGVYDPSIVRSSRKLISSRTNFMIRHNGESVINDRYLGFTFSPEDFIKCRAWVRENGTGRYNPDGKWENGFPRELLPREEQWSARHFKLSDVFSNMSTENTQHIDIDDYHDAHSWETYRLYMQSDAYIEKPPVANWIAPSRYKKSLLDFE